MRTRGSSTKDNTPPPFGGVGTGFGGGSRATSSGSGSTEAGQRRRMHTVFVQQLEFEDLQASQSDDAMAAAVAASRATTADAPATAAAGGDAKPAAGMMALQTDLVAEANQRRIRAINRKLEEEKARAAKQRAARTRGSKASELDALAALERELLAEVTTTSVR
jgi:hypothetical protein